MPSSDERLRAKFMKDGSDGILECEAIIKKHGGDVKGGMIYWPDDKNKVPQWINLVTEQDKEDLGDAIDYLIHEWDYGVGK